MRWQSLSGRRWRPGSRWKPRAKALDIRGFVPALVRRTLHPVFETEHVLIRWGLAEGAPVEHELLPALLQSLPKTFSAFVAYGADEASARVCSRARQRWFAMASGGHA